MTVYVAVDFHAREQTISWCDTAEGEVHRTRLRHQHNDVRKFYEQFKGEVIVAFEASGYSAWFEQMLAELGLLRLQTPDQRYVVLRAVAKRDPAWAKQLMQQMLKPDTETGDASSRNSFNDLLTVERLLDSARQMIPGDVNAAFEFAQISLNYPASGTLTRFLYRLAEVNQQSADQFYTQALAVYRDRPLREFL